MIIGELLFKEESVKNIDKIIILELANQILHENGKNLQEALAAYQIHITNDIQKEPPLEKRFSTSHVDKEVAQIANNTMSDFSGIADTIKQQILSIDKVKKLYDDMIWLGETFHDPFFPISVTGTSLNLKHDIHSSDILALDPTTNVAWRFETIVESLKNLDAKGMTKLVPKFHTDQGSIVEHQDQTKFDYFIRKITGLETSITDGHLKGIDDHITKMLFYPRGDNIDTGNPNPSSKFKSLDISINGNEEQRNLFALAAYNSWTGCKINQKIELFTNTAVPDDVLEHWIEFFVCWILKECIITKENMEDKFSIIPYLAKVKDGEMFKKAKLLQETLEFEKAPDYDEFDRMRKNNN